MSIMSTETGLSTKLLNFVTKAIVRCKLIY